VHHHWKWLPYSTYMMIAIRLQATQNIECHLSIGIGALDQFLNFYEVLQNSLKFRYEL